MKQVIISLFLYSFASEVVTLRCCYAAFTLASWCVRGLLASLHPVRREEQPPLRQYIEGDEEGVQHGEVNNPLQYKHTQLQPSF